MGRTLLKKLSAISSSFHKIQKKMKYYIQLDYFKHVSESLSGNFFPMLL